MIKAAHELRRSKVRFNNDDWPDRIYVDESQYEKIHELYSRSSDIGKELPFKSLKEIVMASAVLGFNAGKKGNIEKSKEIIFTRYLDSTLDIPIAICIAISDVGTVDIVADKKRVIEIFQGYVKGGFDILYDAVNDGNDKIESYAHYVLKNYTKEV